jgi:hypothetical protein
MPDEIVARELGRDTSSATVARLAAQRTKWRTAAATLVQERDAARAEAVTAKQAAIDAAKTGGAEEIASLKATIKLNAHRGKFDELAKAAGVRPKALNDLWDKSGYKADADAPDEAAMTKAIEKQKTDRDYLFEPADQVEADADPAGFNDAPPEPKPGPGRGQGGNRPSTGTQFQATDAQLRNPEWCFANQGKIQQMAKDVATLPVASVGGKFAIM